MIQELSNKLKALFDTLKGTGKPLVEVLDYHSLDNTGYPYLTFEPVEFTASVLDTCDNTRTYSFDVVIFQELTTRKQAKEILSKCLDEVIEVLDKNFTLDYNFVQRVVPTNGRIEPFIIQNGKALVATLRVDIITYANIK